MLSDLEKSRKEIELFREISSKTDEVASDCKRAELAIYQSRMGKFHEALVAISKIRENNIRHPNIVRSVWINLSEGLVSYFESVNPSRSDGILRAYSICNAANLSNLKGLCAAWLAQWDYLNLSFTALASHVVEALSSSDETNYSARSRAFLVGGQALHYGGRLDLARKWYESSRSQALMDQDDATISAIIHNMTWLNMLSLRQAVLSGAGDRTAGRHALLGSESIDNYDKIHGIGSWNDLRPLLRAQILSLEKKYAEALKIYETEVEVQSFPARLQSNMLADKSLCYALTSRFEDSRSHALIAIARLSDDTHVDDRAAVFSMLSLVFDCLGEVQSMEEYKLLASYEWQKQILIQQKAVSEVSSIEAHFFNL
jgi:tetratricopeptide (TPR) repeat protein